MRRLIQDREVKQRERKNDGEQEIFGQRKKQMERGSGVDGERRGDGVKETG